jgi:hypothetical protein
VSLTQHVVSKLSEANDKVRRESSEQGGDLSGFRLDRLGNADKTVVCVDCASEFVFTVVEQELSRYITEPQRCRRCRAKFVPPPPEDDWGHLTGNGHPA